MEVDAEHLGVQLTCIGSQFLKTSACRQQEDRFSAGRIEDRSFWGSNYPAGQEVSYRLWSEECPPSPLVFALAAGDDGTWHWLWHPRLPLDPQTTPW